MLISVFQERFASTNKIFILAGILDTRLSFYEGFGISCCLLLSKDPRSYVVHQPLRQLVYTLFKNKSCQIASLTVKRKFGKR